MLWHPSRDRFLLAGVVLVWAHAARAQPTTIEIEGVSDRVTTSVTPGPADTYEVHGGTVNALATRRPSSGRLVSWTDRKGAFLVWTMRARVTHAGTTARFQVEAATPNAQDLRVALGSETHWENPRAGRAVPLLSPTIVNAAVRSGESFVFEVALPVRNADKPGPRRPQLRYSVEINSALPPGSRLQRAMPTSGWPVPGRPEQPLPQLRP